MIVAGAADAIGLEQRPFSRTDETERRDRGVGYSDRGWIIRQIPAAEVHRQRARVEQLEPIRAGRGRGHPFIKLQIRHAAERRGGGVDRAGCGGGEQLPPGGAAQGLVLHLETVVHHVHRLPERIEQINRAAVAGEEKPVLCGPLASVEAARVLSHQTTT